MSVAELIEQLKQMPQDVTVYVYDPYRGEEAGAETVQFQAAVPPWIEAHVSVK